MIKRTLILASFCALMVGCKKKDSSVAGEKGSKKATEAVVPGKFTENPTAEHVTKGAIKGTANGEKFECKEVFFEVSLGKWNMNIVDTKLEKPLGFKKRGARYVSISLPEVPEEGKILQKKMKSGDGFFQVRKPGSDQTTSWNASNSYYIEFTKWDVKEYNEKKGMFQLAGKASGKVYVAYKGYGDFKNSVVAGTFENVNVRYMGKPKFKY